MGAMKRVYTDFEEDTMRLWFREGTKHLSPDEVDRWYGQAESVVSIFLDSYSSNGVLLDKQNNKESGDSSELPTDVA